MTERKTRIHFRCTECTSSLSAPAEEAGKKMRCPYCARELTVPQESVPEVAAVDPASLYQVDDTPDTPEKIRRRGEFADFVCPVCQTRFAVAPEQAGTTIECPDCGTRSVIPRSLFESRPVPQKSRDPGYSPGLVTNEVYGIDSSGLAGPVRDLNGQEVQLGGEDARPKRPGEFAVYCPLCNTLQYAVPAMVGTKTWCPECGREFPIYPPLEKTATKRDPSVFYEGNSVYGLETDSSTPERNAEQYRPENDPNLLEVVCKLCGTRMYVPRSMIGKKKRCPDCYTDTLVQEKPAERKEAEKKIQIPDPGTYDLAPGTEFPDAPARPAANTTTPPPSNSVSKSPPNFAAYYPASPLAPSASSVRQIPVPGLYPVTSGNRVPQESHLSGAEVVPVPAGPASGPRDESGNRDRKPPVKKKRKAKPRPQEFSDGLVARQVGDDVVLEAVRPPRLAMVNGVFAALASAELWTRLAVIFSLDTIASAMTFYILLPCKEGLTGSTADMVPLLTLMAGMVMVGFISLFSLRLTGICFMALFASGSVAAGPVREWPEEDLMSGLIESFWLLGIMAMSVTPAFLLRFFLSETVWASPILGGTITLLLFPVVLLSFLQSNCPLTGTVILSQFRCCFSWFLLYLQMAILIGLPMIGAMYLPNRILLSLICPILATILPVMAAILIARLAWIIADEARYRDAETNDPHES